MNAFLARLDDVTARRPESAALIDGDGSMTYAQLSATIAERASDLTAAGLRPGDRVALIAENSTSFLCNAFAVWAAGGILVTVYPSSGSADLAYCVERSDPALVLTDEATADRVAAAISADRPRASIDAPAPLPAVRARTIDNPRGLRAPISLVCFTSGSSDRPKAIMHSAEGLVGGLDAYADMWRLDERDTMLVCLPMAWLFGLATASMAALMRGGRAVPLRRAQPELILDAVDRHAVTVLPGVTTMFVKLVEHLEGSEAVPALPSLRFCVSGGEPRNEAVFDRWTALTGRPIHDTYCSSECFPLITYDPVVDPVPRRGSAGRLVPPARLRVVDEKGAEVATGAVGEAICTSPGLFLGYWGDPDQSKAAMTPDGWYRQQDLVRVDDDGYVYVVGRLSDMIIRGGNNVSPGEVERVLGEHPDVVQACVVGMPDQRYGQRVEAAVIPARGRTPVGSELSAFVAEHLAAYKVPAAYHFVDHLPLNPTTGKVDRRAVLVTIENSAPRTVD